MSRWIVDFGKVVRDYYLEITLGLLSAIPLFIDTGVVKVNGYIVLGIGLVVISLSTLQKIKGDRSFVEVTQDIKGKLEQALEAGDKNNKYLRETHALLKKKQEETDAHSRQVEEQNELISRLVKEGLISEKDILGMLQKYRVFYLFCYQDVKSRKTIAKKINQSVQSIRNPSLKAVERLGFIRVASKHNFYVLPYDMLPSSLRDLSELEHVFKKFISEEWEKFLLNIKKKDEVFYEKYIERYPKPDNCSYVIISSNIHDAVIDYIGYNTFTRQFEDLLHNKVNINKLKREVERKKHSIQEFVKSISGELLLVGIKSRTDRDLILKNEKQIKKSIGVRRFIDYGGLEKELEGELRKYVSKVKAKKYAKHISEKSEKYESLLSLLGISLE